LLSEKKSIKKYHKKSQKALYEAAYLIGKEKKHVPSDKHSLNLLLLQSVNMNGSNVTEEIKGNRSTVY